MIVRWLLGLFLLLPIAAIAQSVGSSGPDVNARNVYASNTVQGLMPVGTQAGTSCTLGTTSSGCGGLTKGDCASYVAFTSSSAITVTLPNSLPAGCQAALNQNGAGKITLSAGSGATINTSSGNLSTSAQYVQLIVTVASNSNGTSAVYNVLSAGATSAPQTTTFTSDPQVSAQYNLYGNSLIAQGLNNFPVGTGSATVGTCGATNGVSVYTFPYLGIKFTLPASFGTKTLVGITKYFYGGLSTYSWGTGGQYAWTIYSDNAGVPNTSAAAIGGPSSTLSAGSPSNPQGVSGNVWSLQTFSPGVTLVGGTTYHLVTHNTDADPTHNCTSSDDIYFLNVPPRSPTGAVPTSQFVLETSNTGTSGWTDQTNGNGTYPAFDLRFSDASHYGYSYTELNGSTPNGYNNLVGGVNQTQQTFTVGGSSMTVSSLYVAAGLRSGGGTGLMTATVKQGGTTVATLIGSAIAAAAQSNANQHWINFPISPSITLTSGTAYTVTFTAASGTTYDMYAMRRAINSANYCVVPACGIGSYFHDGTAFFSTNSGGSFSNWGSSGADTDLFFFFQ